jgi:D-glycero-alpha-D-manno-heptose-7-phosphate kinase
MIITRTPFRITLGGGGTDLPSYYEKYGGFIFSFALDKYMFITVKRPFADHLIRLKYNISETVEKISELKHDIARECLTKLKITNSIDVVSMADIPAGSGLGSSSSYTVGLLNALHTMKRDYIPLHDLAEEACNIEMYRLNKPIGKQDQYLATFGGFSILKIAKNGTVKVKRANINDSTIDGLNRNLLSFYTGVQRKNVGILARQTKSTEKNEKQVLDALHYIKESGYKIVDIVEGGNITELGHMFDEHWKHKKRLAEGITNPHFDEIYDIAKKNGALGGKITGAGGGGFFLFYCEEKHSKLRNAMKKAGLKEMRFGFDYEGTKVLANFMDYTVAGN